MHGSQQSNAARRAQLKKAAGRLIDWFIPQSLRETTPEAVRQARLIVGFSIALSLFGMPFALEGYFLNDAWVGLVTFAACAIMGALPFVLRYTGSIHTAGHTLMLILWLILFGLGWITDGLWSTPMISATGIPLVAVLMMGKRGGIVWTIMSALLFALFFGLETGGYNFHKNIAHIPEANRRFDLFATLATQGVIILVLALMYERIKTRAFQQLEEANQKLAEANQQLEQTKSEAVSASQAKSSFLASMSHEIRTPLNAIMGYTELLKEEAADQELDDFQEDLSKIHTSGELLMSLINDILDLSKIEAGKMELYPEPIEVEELLAELNTAIAPLCAKNGNTLRCEIPDGTLVLLADRSKLRQSLLNLLSNAAKFTKQGEIQLNIGLQQDADKSEDYVTFQVRDTGIGMTMEQLTRLFQPFTQAEQSTARNYGGTGLGLTLSQKFCELMGGEIRAESEEGKGSTFTIWLPYKK